MLLVYESEINSCCWVSVLQLQMVFMCMGVDTKSQYLSAVDKDAQAAAAVKDEEKQAEIQSLPEITKSVRNLFESGKIAERTPETSKVRIYESLPEWGVYESKPTELEGVVRATDRPTQGDEIQRGITTSLLSQWTRIGMDDNTKMEKPAFRLAYDAAAGLDSGIFESEPTLLDGVIRAVDNIHEERIQRGLTKSLLGQWSNIGKDEPTQPSNGPMKKPTYEVTPGSGVFENEPTKIEGVVRESDANDESEQIRRGMTKSLLSQWQHQGNEQPRSSARRVITVAEGEGSVCENEPVRRSDVVHADDVVDESEQAMRGMARALLSEWKTKGSEGFQTRRQAINVAEGEGSVSENEPVRRSDVVHADDAAEGEFIQQGTTKMLLGQWKTVGSGQTSKDKAPIVVAEGEGQIAENDPVKLSDVMRENDAEGEQIQQGITRSLLNQWKSMGSSSDDSWKSRTPIVLDEAEGKVLESEPVRRTDVVHSDDFVEDRADVQSGITKSLLSQWKNKGSEEFRSEKKAIILNEAEGTVAESEPAKRRDDIVREDDGIVDTEQILHGTTKNLRTQWSNKASEEFKANKKPIVLAEAEGTVSENQPLPRLDIIREADGEPEEEQIQKGITKSLLAQWKVKGTGEFKAEKRPIVLAEAEDCVAENEPVKRTDVVHAEDVSDTAVERGMTKSLLSQWKSKGSEEFKTERKAVVLAEDEGRVSESEPVRREGVVRADDVTSDGDVVLKGYTKSLLTQWKNKPNEDVKIEKKRIVIEEDEGKIAESTPTVREDVVRYDNAELSDEKVQKGFTKNLREQWMTKGSEKFNKEKQPIIIAEGEGTVSENEPLRRSDVVHCDDLEPDEKIQSGITKNLRAQWITKGSEKFCIEKKAIVIAEDEGTVAENEPVKRSDIVRSDDLVNNDQVQRGITKNLRAQWMNKGSEEFHTEKKTIVIAEDEGTVAESEPVRRSDIVHSDDLVNNDQVQRGITKNLRSQWMNKGSEEFCPEKKTIVIAEDEGTVAESEPVRRSDIVHSDDLGNSDQVQRGITKNLRDQWINKGSEQFRAEKKTIVIAEDEGTVAESEPVRRSNIVHSDDLVNNDQVKRGITKNLRAQWMNKGSEEYRTGKKTVVIAEDEGTVAESEPVRRSDIVHSDDLVNNDQVQSGITKNLRVQWMNKGSEEFRAEKKTIVIAEDEGRVAESEPVRRSDIVHSDDLVNSDQVQKGIAKNLRAQWINKGSEEFRTEKQPIIVAEGEGMVSENEPVRRSDVVHCDETEVAEQVQKGITKNLRAQWMTKGSEKFQIKRSPIVVAEDKGTVSENEPVRLSDVVHCDDAENNEQVQQGMAKNLRAQWMTKGSEEFQVKRSPIVIAEDKGTVSENEPIRRSDVVHCDDLEASEQVQKGFAKNLKVQWMTKGSEQYQKEKKPIVIAEGEGTVAENQPITRSDVVHCDNVDDKDQVQTGITKNLRDQWLTKGSEEFRIDKAPIVIAEGEGTVAENEPVIRSDLVHYDDHESMAQVQRGLTRNLRAQWMTKGSEEYHKERLPIVVAEDEGKVVENEPVRRSGVVHSDEISEEGEFVQRGTTKSLLNRWSNPVPEQPATERRPVVVAEDEGRILESEPTRRTDVVHADDFEAEANVVQKGTTKSLLSQWKCKGTEEFKTERKVINVAEAEGKIAENEPLRRGDVVHADDVFLEQDQVQRGMAKSLMTQWSKKGAEEFKVERKPIILAEAEGKIAESEPIRRDDVIHHDDLDTSGENVSKGLTRNLLSQWAVKGSEKFVVEKKPIVVDEGEGKIAENEPIARHDVVKEDDCPAEGEQVQRGMAKSLVSQWKHKGQEEFCVERKPIIVAEVEGQVVENEPTVRSDVVRSDEISTEGETIKRGTTKTLLTQWKTKGTEEYKPQRKSIIIEDKLPTT